MSSTPTLKDRMLAPFRSVGLNPGVQPREVVAWSLYDFANSGYTTVVLTAVFNAYFVSVVAGDAGWATLAWTATLAVSNLIVMLAMPGIGSLTDRQGSRKTWLAAATLVCVLATVGLGWCGPGDVALAVLLVLVSNLAYAVGESLIAAFLPELAAPRSLGRVSGWGWSLGYCGGLVTLGLGMIVAYNAQQRGEGPTDFVPWTMWITAAVYLLAALPVFLFLRERRSQRPAGSDAKPGAKPSVTPGSAWAALLDVRDSFLRTRGMTDFRRLLLIGAAYQSGIAAVIALAAIYASRAMGFTTTDTLALMFVMNIAAGLGAFGFGYFEDRVGHRSALAITMVGWLAMVAIAALSTSPTGFWCAALVAGLCMGSSQSCGRAMVGAFSPPGELARFYGLWTFATRFSFVIGPLTYGFASWITDGNDRIAIWVLGVYFVLALFGLGFIDESRAARAREPVPNAA